MVTNNVTVYQFEVGLDEVFADDSQSVFSIFSVCGGGGVNPIPCVSTHRISDTRSGPAQLLPPHVKQRSHPHGVRPQIPDR